MILVAALVSATCAMPPGATANASAILKAYNQRSLEIVKLAAAGADQEFSDLIRPDAKFSLGAGDVGRPMGEGVAARAMAADFQGTVPNYFADSELTPSDDPCGAHDAAVGFGTAKGDRWTVILFRDAGGKLESGFGWWSSFQDGWHN